MAVKRNGLGKGLDKSDSKQDSERQQKNRLIKLKKKK